MRKLLFLLPLIALLSACQSKKEICARWAGNQWEREDYWESSRWVQKKLGLNEEGSDRDIERYCEYYKH